MIGRREFGLAGLSAAALLAMNRTLPAQADDDAEDRDDVHEGHGGHAMYEECAEECDECARECDACSAHCTELIVQGRKNHADTLKTCRDCAEICSAAARVVARMGPFSGEICDACAVACAKCGERCEQFKDDKMMARCAKACRECEEVCREMLGHLQQGGAGRR